MLMACSSEYFAGTGLNELSECHRRLPMANSRRRSSRANGVLSLSRLETSAKVVGRRASLAARRLVPMACSISPRLLVKASCWASSIFWSRNTSTAYLSMPAWIAATSAGVIGFRMSMPSTSPAKQGPTWRMVTLIDASLSQRRVAGGNGKRALLLQELHALMPRRWPDAGCDGLAADALALAHVLVGPDMDPLVERADVAVAREDQRRQSRTLLDARAPALDHLGDRARAVGVAAELVDAAVLARVEGRRERRGMEDLALHLEDEFRGLGRPDTHFDRLGAGGVPLVEVLVRPDMDDLVERADFGAPEAAEARQLLACRKGRRPALLDFRDAARLQQVGAHLEDHRRLPFFWDRGPPGPLRFMSGPGGPRSHMTPYSAAARTWPPLNAGITSLANRSICSSVVAIGVPSGMVQITRSSP